MSVIKIKQDYIVLSKKLVEEVFPNTNAVFIKIYLHILMLSANGENIEYSAIAQKLQLLESDVMQAVRYWENIGALSIENEEAAIPKPKSEKTSEDYDLENVTEKIDGSSSLTEMMQFAQQVLGKTISSSEMKSLYWIYDELQFAPEVILMLLEYCVSINKKSLAYIEKVAMGWHKNGIRTIEDVEKFLQGEEEKKDYKKNLKFVFGIKDRDFTGIEEEYISKWHDNWNMSEEMIALAYEYSILRINKLSFPYIDKIIEGWHLKGISTISEAEKDSLSHKQNQKEKSDLGKSDCDMSELEKFTWDKLNG